MTEFLEPPGEDKTTYAAPALEKGLDILELLAEAGEPLSTRAIAERLERSKGEIFRMVFVLQQRGYLVREAGTDRLALSRRLFDLGIRTPRGRQLTSIVLPLMERFSEESGQAAHLVVLSRGQTVVIATTSGHLDATVTVRPGYGRPALEANSGLLILAFQSQTRRRALMRDGSPADHERLDDPALEQVLGEIRALGHRIAPSRDIMAVTDIACPVIGPAGHAEAAILVPSLQRHGWVTDEVAILETLKAVCKEAGAQLAL
ncbi:MAG: helix-turn-helix domain-containing protein [Bosea sp. (in: a-proteobacteria)]|uniref:IclR family transcriptional regulator n=1 Tax=Bosea sp. (in: a-proteobacteria) TaxID=1871050 RepID=UPI0027360A7B|nr:helix-turn-helix domain-containing protein [Bosea sp. (in: a-proteobacteria)]MDP3601272.1 helix-turn-helix domain-containing protein [Bosea sp. (in: a-proteobacteria)]